jgi:ankyrin repeat protein
MEEEGRSRSGCLRLRKAIWDNDMERLEELTKDYSADELREIVNMPRRRDGATPLIIASQEGYKEIVEYLLGAGANVNGAGSEGTVPLGYAIMSEEAGTAQHDSIVHTLLDAGANVNAVTKGGGTALMVAAEEGKDNIVRALLDKGANVNATTTEGESPLMLAEKGDHKEIIDMLEAVRRVVKVKGDFSQEAIPLTGSKYDPYQPGGGKKSKKS